MPSWTITFIPMMKMVAIMIVMKVAVTGPGIARTTASALGRQAMAINAAPSAEPMMREPMPVISTIDVPVGRNPSGIVPASPDSRLPVASAVTAPCTARKSIALGFGQDTRCTATDPLMVWMVQTTAMNRNPGSSAQKATPKSRSTPDQAASGSPTQGAFLMRSKS